MVAKRKSPQTKGSYIDRFKAVMEPKRNPKCVTVTLDVLPWIKANGEYVRCAGGKHPPPKPQETPNYRQRNKEDEDQNGRHELYGIYRGAEPTSREEPRDDAQIAKDGYYSGYAAVNEPERYTGWTVYTLENLPQVKVNGKYKRCEGGNIAVTRTPQLEDTPNHSLRNTDSEGTLDDRTQDGPEKIYEISRSATLRTCDEGRVDLVNNGSGSQYYAVPINVPALRAQLSDMSPGQPTPSVTVVHPVRRAPAPTIFPPKIKDNSYSYIKQVPNTVDFVKPDQVYRGARDLRQKVLNRAFLNSNRAVMGDQLESSPVGVSEIPLETYSASRPVSNGPPIRRRNDKHTFNYTQERETSGYSFESQNFVRRNTFGKNGEQQTKPLRFTKAPRPPRQPFLRPNQARSCIAAPKSKLFPEITTSAVSFPDINNAHDPTSDDVRPDLHKIHQSRATVLNQNAEQPTLPAITSAVPSTHGRAAKRYSPPSIQHGRQKTTY